MVAVYMHLLMPLDTSSVMEPAGIIGRFGSFNIIRPPPGDPAGADQTPSLCPDG